MIWIEAFATVFGLLCVWLTIRQNIWCWPTGLVQVILFVVIFYEVKLYSDLMLHIIYIGMQIYGWYHWLYGGSNHSILRPSRLTKRSLFTWISVAILGSLMWGGVMSTFTDAALPIADAFIAITSLVAQWLITQKKLESWLFWITVDVVAIWVYLSKSLYFTSVLYTVFFGLATAGFFAWRKSFIFDKKQENLLENRSDVGQIRTFASGTSETD